MASLTASSALKALIPIGGAIGIGLHSWHLLLEALVPTVENMQPGLAHDMLHNLVASRDYLAGAAAHAHSHVDSHASSDSQILDPNAAWFALMSVLVKEYLYRLTRKVAMEEASPVLLANALHHRSDAYTSSVALIAILGSIWLPNIPLDPIGGTCADNV